MVKAFAPVLKNAEIIMTWNKKNREVDVFIELSRREIEEEDVEWMRFVELDLL